MSTSAPPKHCDRTFINKAKRVHNRTMRTITPPSLRRKTIAIVGCGQIGGSIIRRLSQLRPKPSLLATDRDRRLAAKIALFAEWATDLQTVVNRSDVIIIATPVPAVITILQKIAAVPRPRRGKLLIIDTGTVRESIDREAGKYRSRFDHVGLHPLAGTEGQGWESSRSDLFAGRTAIVTPQAKSRNRFIRDLLSGLGAKALPMDAKAHDRLVAECIGLPHLLAYAAKGMSHHNPLRAGSWNSLTRVASSDPEMVAGFLVANAAAQAKALLQFRRQLRMLEKSLHDRSGRLLLKLLTQWQRTDT